MLEKIKIKFFSRTCLILYGISAAAGLIYGLIVLPLYLHFIDGITFTCFAYLLIGIFRWGWTEGDFTFFSWHPDKKQRTRAPGEKYYGTSSNPSAHMSYRDYRSKVRDERKTAANPFLYAGVLLLIVVAVLAAAY